MHLSSSPNRASIVLISCLSTTFVAHATEQRSAVLGEQECDMYIATYEEKTLYATSACSEDQVREAVQQIEHAHKNKGFRIAQVCEPVSGKCNKLNPDL